MSDLEIVSGPALESRGDVATLGIRETVPFRTMLSNRDRLLAELVEWITQRGVEPSGPFFLRLHVVNMAADMDVEVGVAATGPADDRVRAGVLPAGDYAVLAYRNKSMAANKALHGWIQDQGLVLDTHPEPAGEAFASRLETYLTDPRTEPRKTKWVVELAFKVRR
ncbi:AraC family transcriptional regulator [Glaciihabitans arcticus]|uniref:AraC family transcriptional regulator n=1 Tax=Glaciihabitans arcticus TaxID=2668039 RepID=A0A4Q9GZR0_9MICO|nr:GyrI-like domain-containing protein [Glaciihabitans arcticus]TBN58323.1 AraC family transcriptional regulator [Glaciihabitans arcticus]